MGTHVVGPVERDLRGILAPGSVNQVYLGPKKGFPATVAEAHAHGRNILSRDLGRAVTEALRPKIAGLLAAPRNRPVFDDWLPRPSAILGPFDAIPDVGLRRIARGDVGGGVNGDH